MLKPATAKNARRRNQARRSRTKWRGANPLDSPHGKAIRLLRIQLQAEDGLFCCFHSGVDWRCAQNILPRGSRVVVEIERPVMAGGRRYVPDLKVSCARTHRPILLIEVWHTHAVNRNKRRAYNELGLPWIEVKSWHVLQRFRSRPLAILDWGGAGMPDAPFQGDLFETDDASALQSARPATGRKTRRPAWRAKPEPLDSLMTLRLSEGIPPYPVSPCN